MFLTPNDFEVKKDELICKIRGFVFVFFISRDCDYCEDVKPAFNRLTQIIEGCQFAYIDVDQNQHQIVRMSYQTKNKITYVPLLYLFINGQNVGQFFPDEDNPANNLQKMTEFLLSYTPQGNNTVATANTVSNMSPNADIPPYSLGIPGNMSGNKRVCYVNFDSAYR
jgi:glutaredoxin